MLKRFCLSTIFLLLFVCAKAENWDEVVSSKDYYYGIGSGATQSEADENALNNLMNSIVVHVASDFKLLEEQTTSNGKIDYNSKVLNCLKTYSQGSFTNVRSLTKAGKGNEVLVLRYMTATELKEIYQRRIDAANNWVDIAEQAIERNKVDMALQYYYHAYALVRSLQHPYDAKDAQGRALATILPLKIREVLDKIDVSFESQDGEFINLFFTYEGKPLNCIDFSYNDGQAKCEDCRARDGRGCLEMAKGYEDNEVFHVSIEYEYKSQARGDAELESVLNVIPRSIYKEATHIVKRVDNVTKEVAKLEETTISERVESVHEPQAETAVKSLTEQSVKPSVTQQPNDISSYAMSMNRVVEAMRSNNYNSVNDLFDIDGLDVYNQLQKYGSLRLIGGEQNLSYFNGSNGTVMARGMQVSFSFTSPKKVSFTEELVFTFNKEGKICNIAFGLGKTAEEDILCSRPWDDAVKEQIMQFMENYKTAYCLKRLDYIRDIFADDAVIIVGKITHRSGQSTNIGEHQITEFGRDIITHNRYTKEQYLKNLESCFRNPRNKYINVKFAENEVQTLNSFDGHKVFGIQIKQMYNSATYGDVGYLFLMVDMTNPDEPQIKVRTWQPNETSLDQLFSAGDFY